MENEFSKIENLLEAEAKKIVPPPAGLKYILERLPQAVTKPAVERNISARAHKGRVLDAVIHDINFFMTNIWKIAVSTAVIAVVVIAVGFWRMNAGSNKMSANNQPAPGAQKVEFASSEVNSTIDDLANEAIDMTLIEAEDADSALVDGDSEQLDNLDNITNLYE